MFQDHSFLYFLIFFTFKTVAGGLAGPAWGSMMADLAAESIRGRYFSRRNMINNAFGLGMGFIAMIVMQYYQRIDDQFTGFSWIFGSALTLRLIAVALFTGICDPPSGQSKQKPGSITAVIKNIQDSNVGKFMIAVSLTVFAMNISGPFFSVYLLRDMNFDYFFYMLILGSGGVFAVVLQPFRGHRADVYGNVKIIKLVMLLMPLVPISYIFSANIFYLIGIQALNAFLLTGFNLAAINFMFDATGQHQRTQHLAVFNMFIGLAACGGSLLGGVLAVNLPPLFGYQLKMLFLVAGLLRLAVIGFGYRQIKEVRPVPNIGIFNYLLGRYPRMQKGRPGNKQKAFSIMPDFQDDEYFDQRDEHF